MVLSVSRNLEAWIRVIIRELELEFQKPFEQQINKWCNKSRSFISLQYMHSIEVGITVQGEDLNQLMRI